MIRTSHVRFFEGSDSYESVVSAEDFDEDIDLLEADDEVFELVKVPATRNADEYTLPTQVTDLQQ